jgi:hypothetical protein
MSDEKPQSAEPVSEPQPTPAGEQVHIGEELSDLEGKEDRLQSMKIVGAVLLVVAVIVAAYMLLVRPKPKATGAIDGAYAVALQGDNVLVTINVTFSNVGGKPIWIRNIQAEMTAPDGKTLKDDAANAVDFERYFRGYPDLRSHSLQPLKVETKLQPGEQTHGSVIVGFPVSLDTFSNRKSLSVIIEPYDLAPITIVQTKFTTSKLVP